MTFCINLTLFSFKWRPGNACERPDALSRRDQDKPIGLSDERNAGRIIKILTGVLTNSTSLEEIDNHPQTQTLTARIFNSDEMQNLWRQAVDSDKDWIKARDAVQAGHRQFPSDIALKSSVNITEYSLTCLFSVAMPIRRKADPVTITSSRNYYIIRKLGQLAESAV